MRLGRLGIALLFTALPYLVGCPGGTTKGVNKDYDRPRSATTTPGTTR